MNAFLAGCVNAAQVLHDLTGQQKMIEQEVTLLPLTAHAHSAALAKRAYVLS